MPNLLLAPLGELLELLVGDGGDELVAEIGDEVPLQHNLVVAPADFPHPCCQLLIHLSDDDAGDISEPLADNG